MQFNVGRYPQRDNAVISVTHECIDGDCNSRHVHEIYYMSLVCTSIHREHTTSFSRREMRQEVCTDPAVDEALPVAEVTIDRSFTCYHSLVLIHLLSSCQSRPSHAVAARPIICHISQIPKEWRRPSNALCILQLHIITTLYAGPKNQH